MTALEIGNTTFPCQTNKALLYRPSKRSRKLRPSFQEIIHPSKKKISITYHHSQGPLKVVQACRPWVPPTKNLHFNQKRPQASWSKHLPDSFEVKVAARKQFEYINVSWDDWKQEEMPIANISACTIRTDGLTCFPTSLGIPVSGEGKLSLSSLPDISPCQEVAPGSLLLLAPSWSCEWDQSNFFVFDNLSNENVTVFCCLFLAVLAFREASS